MLLSDKLLSHREWPRPRIVVGDFNEWTRGLASRLMAEVFETAKPKTLLWHRRTYLGIFPVLDLDHFYYDNQLALHSFQISRSRTALVASDHLPLVAELEVGVMHCGDGKLIKVCED